MHVETVPRSQLHGSLWKRNHWVLADRVVVLLSSQLLSIHVSSHQSLTWNNAPLVRTLSQSSYATRPGRPLAPYKHTFAPLPKCYQTNDFGSGHTLFIKCVQVAALGHVKSPGRGAYAHAAKKTFFFFFFFFFFFYKAQCYCVYWVRVGCSLMPVCLTCHCLVPVNQTVRVSVRVQHWHCDLRLSQFNRRSDSTSMHDWSQSYSRGRLKLAMACSDPPTHAQHNRNAHAVLLVRRCGGGAASSHGSK